MADCGIMVLGARHSVARSSFGVAADARLESRAPSHET